ncbi:MULTISPECIES: hemophore-related protein [unclassified Mycolicibacterium]|uniref:hemophore-related protein n=1 Tax=unclassified Mycolicibacterium TaxID=2636767 RepID=UPI00130A0C84|nr:MULTISPECIES: hemophore-related protein [unclassified Mycolicibacterium]MUL83401.1 hemophore-related protein [Mycolicibacterium sp. CBMA 329]MUL90392.1 hemophore-related protein [Mycolicibacterium sp. CBMA 331]MUM00365.1 hemophore-related protein [Mycolicibacterium sp. CBMA 334]MUM29552.1 hemophore-related protein [Mycolicibacterium sp. CBMA 295]MUM41336.1 hemophore-related protein [Mycolicibacterium sp. CBMA 247]
MIKSSRKYIAAALGGLALSVPLTALSAGVASAQPDFSAVVNTTCSYEQVMAALNAQRPDLAQEFNASPFAQGALRNFLASGPVERQQTVAQLQGSPMAQQYFGPINLIAGSCNRY